MHAPGSLKTRNSEKWFYENTSLFKRKVYYFIHDTSSGYIISGDQSYYDGHCSRALAKMKVQSDQPIKNPCPKACGTNW